MAFMSNKKVKFKFNNAIIEFDLEWCTDKELMDLLADARESQIGVYINAIEREINRRNALL